MKFREELNILKGITPKLRPILFWDTKPESIDWQKQRKAIIQRVFERGNEQEKGEITRFYGKNEVESILYKIENNYSALKRK